MKKICILFLDKLAEKCIEALEHQGFAKNQIKTEKYLHMRYHGTDCALMVTTNSENDFISGFLKRYQTEFGFTLKNRSILVDDVRVRGVGCTDFDQENDLSKADIITPEPVEIVQVFFDQNYEETKVYKMEQVLLLFRKIFLNLLDLFWITHPIR